MPASGTFRLLLPVVALMALLLTAGTAAFVYLASRPRGAIVPWKTVLVQLADASPWRGIDLGLLLLLLAMAQFLRPSLPDAVGWDVLAFQGVLIAGIAWRVRGKVRPFGGAPPIRSIASQALLRWLAILPLLWFVAFVWQFVLKAAGHAPDLQEAILLFLETDDVRMRILFFVFAAVLAPIAEEALFRGLLLPILVRRIGALAGMALTSIGFAALHADLGTFLPLAIFSVALSLAYARSGTLLVPILMHAVFNAVNLALLLALARAGVV